MSGNTTTNNNNKANKNNKKKRFNNNKNNNNSNNKPYFNGNQPGNLKKKSKTLFIGKIYNEDIGDSVVSSQLALHRIEYLKSVLESYGEVEHFSNNIENNNFVLVTYRTREMAEKALKKLKSRNENENIMGEIKEQLRKSKLPDTVCPLLYRYKYDWSDKPSRAPKNAYSSTKKVTYQKNEGSSVTPSTQPAQKKKVNEPKVNGSKPVNNNNTTVSEESKKKKKKKPKKKYQKKTESDEKVETVLPPTVKKVVKAEPVKKEVKKEPKVDADGLRREADKAKLQDELEYLAAQLENVQSEINAENKRCKDRDVRINKLTEELRRVDLAKERLERQLNNERRWKKLNQDTVNQLNQELTHIREEQQSATLRLNQSDSADQSPFSFTS